MPSTSRSRLAARAQRWSRRLSSQPDPAILPTRILPAPGTVARSTHLAARRPVGPASPREIFAIGIAWLRPAQPYLTRQIVGSHPDIDTERRPRAWQHRVARQV